MGEPDYLYLLPLSPLHYKSFYRKPNLVDFQPGFQIRVAYSLSESDPDIVGRWELRITGNNINPDPDTIRGQLVSSLEGTYVPPCMWHDVVLAATDVFQRIPPVLAHESAELRIIIDRYLNIEEEEEYEDGIFVWEMFKAIGSMVMSMFRRRESGYFRNSR